MLLGLSLSRTIFQVTLRRDWSPLDVATISRLGGLKRISKFITSSKQWFFIFTRVRGLDVQHFQCFCLLDLADAYYDTPHRVVFLTSYEYRIVSSKSISDSLPGVKLSLTSLKGLYIDIALYSIRAC